MQEAFPLLNIWKEKPQTFTPEISVVCAIIKCKDKILLAKRSPQKDKNQSWELPGGKREKGEEISESLLRELCEETGLTSFSELLFFTTLYLQKEFFFELHIFECLLEDKAPIQLSEEHSEYAWVSLEEAKKLPLLAGGDYIFTLYEEYLKNRRKLWRQ